MLIRPCPRKREQDGRGGGGDMRESKRNGQLIKQAKDTLRRFLPPIQHQQPLDLLIRHFILLPQQQHLDGSNRDLLLFNACQKGWGGPLGGLNHPLQIVFDMVLQQPRFGQRVKLMPPRHLLHQRQRHNLHQQIVGVPRWGRICGQRLHHRTIKPRQEGTAPCDRRRQRWQIVKHRLRRDRRLRFGCFRCGQHRNQFISCHAPPPCGINLGATLTNLPGIPSNAVCNSFTLAGVKLSCI